MITGDDKDHIYFVPRRDDPYRQTVIANKKLSFEILNLI